MHLQDWRITSFTALVSASWVACSVPSGDRIDGLGEIVLPSTYLGDESTSVGKLPHASKLYRMGLPVARMIVEDPNIDSTCTAFLVTRSIAITNHHCTLAPGASYATFRFHHETDEADNPVDDVRTSGSLIASNQDLDVALYQLNGAPGQRFGTVRIAMESPVVGQELVSISHPSKMPNGFVQPGHSITPSGPKVYSIQDCYISALDDTYAWHRCDTDGGSSGSPLFLRDGRVIALHHWGGATGQDPNSQNRAVRMDRILDWLDDMGVSISESPDMPGTSTSSRDYDGDGRSDIALAAWDGNASSEAQPWDIARSTGSSFLPSTSWSSSIGVQGGRTLPGDFNGDKKDDLLYFKEINETTTELWVSLSTGSSLAPSSLWGTATVIAHNTAVVGDFNGDGKDDLTLAQCDFTCNWIVTLSSGSAFGSPATWSTGAGYDTDYVRAGDVTGDGYDDIVLGALGQNGLSFSVLSPKMWSKRPAPYPSLGYSFVYDPHFVLLSSWGSDLAGVNDRLVVADATGDRKADLVVLRRRSVSIFGVVVPITVVAVAPSDGIRFAPPTTWTSTIAHPATTMLVGDFTGDGKADLAIAYLSGGTRDLFLHRSTGSSFGAIEQWASGIGGVHQAVY